MIIYFLGTDRKTVNTYISPQTRATPNCCNFCRLRRRIPYRNGYLVPDRVQVVVTDVIFQQAVDDARTVVPVRMVLTAFSGGMSYSLETEAVRALSFPLLPYTGNWDNRILSFFCIFCPRRANCTSVQCRRIFNDGRRQSVEQRIFPARRFPDFQCGSIKVERWRARSSNSNTFGTGFRKEPMTISSSSSSG